MYDARRRQDWKVCLSRGLTRTRKKVDVNPFVEGLVLVETMHDVGKHFSYSNRLQDLHKLSEKLPNPDQARITIKLDLNTTRVASVHSLLLSEIRMMHAAASL